MKYHGLSWILLFLSVVPLLIAAISMPFLPDQIPMSYNIEGEITSWGSKYEEFIVALLFSLPGWTLWILAKFSGFFASSEEEYQTARNNIKPLLITGIATQLFLCVMKLLFLIAAAKEGDIGAVSSVLPIWKVVGTGMGALFTVVGIVLPKTKPNSLIGVRTPQSFSSEEAWAISQHIGGISFAIGGILCIVFSIFLDGFAILWALLIIVLGAIFISVLYPLYAMRK